MKEEFSQIAAYEDKEIADAIERIVNSEDFLRWYKKTTGHRFSAFLGKMVVGILRHSRQPLRVIDYCMVFPFLQNIKRRSTKGVYIYGMENVTTKSSFYITNHRDIILDAAFLSYLLRTKRDIRPYLGVGNNLFGMKWIEDLMRVCRCFAVIRNGGPREVMHNAEVLSAYIADRQAANQSFWMAQREGRAKDGNDTTQPAVLKMLTLAGDGEMIDKVKKLHLTPVAITYEFDPCDYLKAKEMQLKRDNPAYKKTAAEDMRNMQKGLRGQKGVMSFVVTPCINNELDNLRADWNTRDTQPNRNEQLAEIASVIDRQIHKGYRLAWTNIAAKEILEGKTNKQMEDYVASRIALINIPNRDDAFLREQILTMYANPAINQAKAKNEA